MNKGRKWACAFRVTVFIFLVLPAIFKMDMAVIAYGALLYWLLDEISADLDFFMHGIERKNVIVDRVSDDNKP